MNIWAVLPAAGTGTRMKLATPKQYLPLAGSSVIDCTVQRLLQLDEISGLLIAVSSAELQDPDSDWHRQPFHGNPRISVCSGGAQRQETVFRALQALESRAAADDWVMVHDAVRPCIRSEDIRRLLRAVSEHECGGLLATPVRDTLKRAETLTGDTVQVAATLDRDNVWAALTPQIFRYGLLHQALQQARDQGSLVTDEASAMEALGYRPLLVAGKQDNIKITHPQDLPLAGLILELQQQGGSTDV